jgi:hypothetical protein
MAIEHTECRRNGHSYHWSWYCGDRVCDVCIKHETRIHCSCGWPESVREKESGSVQAGTVLLQETK